MRDSVWWRGFWNGALKGGDTIVNVRTFEIRLQDMIADMETLEKSALIADDATGLRESPDQLFVKLLDVRDKLIKGDADEAYHELYSIADPTFTKRNPWENWEAKRDTALGKDKGKEA